MIIGATLGTLKNISRLKEQLFFMLDTGVKEFMEVCQLFYLMLVGYQIV